LGRQDADSGQVVVKGNTACDTFRQTGDVNNYRLAFNLDFTAKDNRVRFVFEDLEILDSNGQSVQYAYNQIVDKGKAEQAKSCLAPVKDGFMKTINAGGTDW
jgi:hypothetical protein